MRLYLFNERDGKIIKYVYDDVVETKALYKLKVGYFQTLFVSQIKKDEINKIKDCGYWGIAMLTENDDLDDFWNKAIEIKSRHIGKLEEELSKEKDILRKLSNKEYEFVERVDD